MNEKILITTENYFEVFNSLKYGYIYVTYKDEESSILFNQMITVMNEYFDSWVVEQKEAVISDMENGLWVDKKVEGVYQIIYKSYYKELPILHKDNYDIEKLAIEASKNNEIVYIKEFEPKLIKYAKKISKKHDVKFIGNGFNGKIKSTSVKFQIESAFMSGKNFVSFLASEYSAQSVRNQASSYSSILGRKIRVELKVGEIIVHLKEKNELDLLMENAKEIFNRIGVLLGEEKRDLFFESFLNTNKPNTASITIEAGFEYNGKVYDHSEWAKQPIWIRQGYESEYNMENDIKGPDATPKNESFDDDSDF